MDVRSKGFSFSAIHLFLLFCFALFSFLCFSLPVRLDSAEKLNFFKAGFERQVLLECN